MPPAQAFFKEAYKARVRKNQNDPDSDGRGGRGGRGGGRTEAWLENLCQVRAGHVLLGYVNGMEQSCVGV